MLNAITILELYSTLSPREQDKCRELIAAAPVAGTASKTKKRPQLLPEHRTDALVRALVIRDNGIRFKNTNLQAVKVC